VNLIEAICLEQTRDAQPNYLRRRIDWPFAFFWTLALTAGVAFWYEVFRALLRVL
jgi:hypothetical protein